jgi:hypothetical protein
MMKVCEWGTSRKSVIPSSFVLLTETVPSLSPGWIGAELHGRGPQCGLEHERVSDGIYDLASAVGGREHDDPSQIRDPMVGEVCADQDASERVGHEVDARLGRTAALELSRELRHELAWREVGGVVSEVVRPEPRLLELRFEKVHGPVRPAEAVEQYDRLGSRGRT